MDKTELLTKIEEGYATLNTLLASLNEAQMTQPRVQDQWSVKDIVAHVAAWQSLCAEWLEVLARGETPPQARLWDDESVNQANEQFFKENEQRPLPDTLSDFHQSYRRMLNAVNALSDEDINNRNRYAWRQGRPLLDFIIGNSYGHYPEHG